MSDNYAENVQRQLLAALYGGSDAKIDKDDRIDPRALDVYRRNLYASSLRALQISYPTLYLLSGENFFRSLAMNYLRRYPFKEGDWGEWGKLFPDFLKREKALEAYPYFSSVAELDWLIHSTERHADQHLDAGSFELLASESAEHCRLILSPLVKVVESDHPIVDIFHAHQEEPNAEQCMSAAREKIAASIGQSALVYRPQNKVYVEDCSACVLAMYKGILDGLCVGQLVELGQTLASFDFEAWLQQSVEKRIILGVQAGSRAMVM